MMRYVASPGNSPSIRAMKAAKEARVADRRQERLEYARRRFPNVSDREALEMLRDWEDDHR
jgi:hypothetical protein